MAIHQVLSYARAGDAVTNQALALRETLDAFGPSRLLAHAVDSSVRDRISVLAEAGDVAEDDLVLYHVTIGCRPAVDWVRARRRHGLVYHNITPATFFAGLSPEHERLCRDGRDELAALVEGARPIIADSSFNADEIAALGGAVDAVHPPIVDVRRLDAYGSPPDQGEDHVASLVSIGQIAPHKQPEALAMAHHLATTHLGLRAPLVLIGSQPIAAQAEALRQYVETMALNGCSVLGAVDDDQLASSLRRARALVSASVHEGFCVPVVEAMAAGVPVVARGAGAVPETAGGAALLLPADASPSLLAEAMRAIETDDRLHADLRRRGLARAAEIDRLADPANLVPLLGSLA